MSDFIFAKLAASAVIQTNLKVGSTETLKIFKRVAPKNAVKDNQFPLIVHSWFIGDDIQYPGMKRAGTKPEYLIRVAFLDIETDQIRAIDAEIDRLFGFVKAEHSGGYRITMRRFMPFDQTITDEVSGRPINSIGGRYRTIMQPILS